MDSRTKRLIEKLLPHPREADLEPDEYYYSQTTSRGEQVLKVKVFNIIPHEDETEYVIYRKRGENWVKVDVGFGDDPFRGTRMANLYDNRRDCENQTHWSYDRWETLRRAQRDEMDASGR